MNDVVIAVVSGAAGAAIGGHLAVANYRKRLRDAARAVPRDSVALATLQRLMRDGQP